MSIATQTKTYIPQPSAPEPPSRVTRIVDRMTGVASGWLSRYSIDILRVSLGVVFFVFGALKFVPGMSPAEGLVERTLETLTLGMVSGTGAMLITAVAECVIGITLMTGRFLRVGLAVLAASMVGIMSPLVLFFGDLVGNGVTLEAQYVFKDIVLVAGGLVVAAKALGATLVAARR